MIINYFYVLFFISKYIYIIVLCTTHIIIKKKLYIIDSPFDLERCGPAVDLALERVNEEFLKSHKIQLRKVQGRYVYMYIYRKEIKKKLLIP